ncbi:MAG TPA: LysM domain-containing protein, partial [Casimicrobiaceae bacterium]
MARATLERAQQLDPANDLARKLMDQIRADPQKELGPVFFRYTVQKDDTLSKLAQQFLGDRFRFYILARYNDITNPSRLAAGQVIRIPGRAPPPTAAAPAPAAPAPAPATASEPAASPASPPAEAKPRDDAAEALAKAAQLEKSGNLEGAYTAYVDAAQRYPASAEAAKRRDAARANLVRSLDREASQAFQRQNLDLAIAKWDRVL